MNHGSGDCAWITGYSEIIRFHLHVQVRVQIGNSAVIPGLLVSVSPELENACPWTGTPSYLFMQVRRFRGLSARTILR
jgi:hypothetical protein